MPQPSAKSKKQDQLWMAKAELSKQDKALLKRYAKYSDVDFLDSVEAGFGRPTRRRLFRTAKRAKMGPVAYVQAKLID